VSCTAEAGSVFELKPALLDDSPEDAAMLNRVIPRDAAIERAILQRLPRRRNRNRTGTMGG
jgi:hypothetical protein